MTTTEKYFKALGAVQKEVEIGFHGKHSDGKEEIIFNRSIEWVLNDRIISVHGKLPDITESFYAFKEKKN